MTHPLENLMDPKTLRYATTHEWASLEGDLCTVGITKFAVDQLTDVVYIELPEVGAKLKQGQSFGTIESVKAVSELYSPVSGEVVDVNTALKDKPDLVNKSPHTSWLIAIKLTNPDEVGLLDATQYQALVK
jgi:glycine cleavage system H protein